MSIVERVYDTFILHNRIFGFLNFWFSEKTIEFLEKVYDIFLLHNRISGFLDFWISEKTIEFL